MQRITDGTLPASPLERLLAPVAASVPLVAVQDAHPMTLAWLGGVRGHRVRPLGVSAFGQSGNIPHLYKYYDIDAAAIVRTVRAAAGSAA